jgi:3-hydroxybutyryl-CoA dehydratase
MTYSVGQKASFSKTISESDVYQFAGISGDFNPVHVNKEAAEKSRFKRRVAHGALVSSFISTVLGTRMPGEGTIYMAQNSSFLKPVYIGDTVTAICEIIEIDGRKAKIKTEVLNQIDEIVLTGEALVLLPSDD